MRTRETHVRFEDLAPLASVRRDRRDWHVAHVPVVTLSDLHWDPAPAPARRDDGPVLYAFTSSDSVVAGELDESRAAPAHPIRVCILREDNDRAVFERLRLEAGPPPRPRPAPTT